MSNKLLSAIFGAGLAALAMSPAALAGDVLADTHTDMGGCESCHVDGDPSADGAQENAACVECHGDMGDMGEPHDVHEGILNCLDCHIMHEQTAADKPQLDAADPKCADCHG
ncbi:cytochrome c3 family protein [Paraferrimonas haliotis]|uniref:Cytochrome c n=1 Tax=Paraferrimonas haliotis TaxID=2013866 RepID=A0AA37TQB4_9GAMM|nr:cytochrome c3 family protein [Paraferrimonas haliotis]GLS82666.1 cytochrome c [Paraferrimonas haliotis]